jgi:hypothetical protein
MGLAKIFDDYELPSIAALADIQITMATSV